MLSLLFHLPSVLSIEAGLTIAMFLQVLLELTPA